VAGNCLSKSNKTRTPRNRLSSSGYRHAGTQSDCGSIHAPEPFLTFHFDFRFFDICF
jgi:hypothetical protein